MSNAENRSQKGKIAPWVPLAKDVANLLPVDRPYTEMEAVFSLQLDHNNERSVSILGYSKLWGWNRKKVKSFFNCLSIEIEYPFSTEKVRKQLGKICPKKDEITGHKKRHKKGHINFIDFNKLRTKMDIIGDIRRDTTHENKRKVNKKHMKDPRVRVFQEWWFSKFKHKFNREYTVTNWGKFGSQIKSLLKAFPDWEDLQYLAIEFLLDEDPFITGSEKKSGAGHNVGMLLTKINQNAYGKYQDPEFRESNKRHIINENGSPKYPA